MSDSNKKHEYDDNDIVDMGELDALRQELTPMLNMYRDEVLQPIEPSAAYRTSMHKMMLGLVRDDVLEVHKKSSLATRLAARSERWLACWRELVATSFLFRLGTQGAFALGLGLLLSMAWISAMDKEPLAARTSIEKRNDALVPETSNWTLRISEKDALPPSPLGDLPKSVPAKRIDSKKR
ncbi:MAG: hypothetical protein ACI97A_002923 [Planctomycetota bacterium]|jgi:hypothetical protein